MGNALAAAVEDPPQRAATNACADCVDLGEQALERTLEGCRGVDNDAELVGVLRWALPQQSLATNGCAVQAACFEALGISTLIHAPSELADADYAAAFLRVARRYGRLHSDAAELERRLARHRQAVWWRHC